MRFLYKYNNWAALPLRIAVGLIFLVHGYMKLFGGLEGTAQFFSGIGIPFPGFFAVFVGIIEFFGGVFLIGGLLTRYVSLLLAMDMIAAILTVHLQNGFFLPNGYEFTLALLGGSLALMLSGAQSLSFDSILFNK